MARFSFLSRTHRRAFTLIELLVVISIISVLISILIPSLSRAREQGKSVHCLARLKEFGNALGTYENVSQGSLPPARWYPNQNDLDYDKRGKPRGHDRPVTGKVEYGWAEILFSYVYRADVRLPDHYPALRNASGHDFEEYFICQAVGDPSANSGHYRVYLPAWSAGSFQLERNGVYGDTTRADPFYSANRERIRPTLPLIGDANDLSERGDGTGIDDCSYIDASEADYAGSDGRIKGNRFSARHYGGTNYLFQDLHAAWNTRLRRELARDYDLNGVIDPELVP